MQFAIFDHLDRRDEPLRQFYEDRLKLAEVAERLGFHAYHIAEHHGTPLGMAPSPNVFLAALALAEDAAAFNAPLVSFLNQAMKP